MGDRLQEMYGSLASAFPLSSIIYKIELAIVMNFTHFL
ncbi:hypothetical protein GLO73106DRAFT_00014730 [Gloeocapsa sp. PCC 73106]|nr:hypothetical protein GLO73106DRAFT_00014730 [Gloeocapsa sp. PCC 73106]